MDAASLLHVLHDTPAETALIAIAAWSDRKAAGFSGTPAKHAVWLRLACSASNVLRNVKSDLKGPESQA